MITDTFDYSVLKEHIDSGKPDEAVAYYEQHFPSYSVSSTLRERLEIVGQLEKDYHFLGCSVTPKAPSYRLTSTDSVDFVVASLCQMADLSRRLDSIPFAQAEPQLTN